MKVKLIDFQANALDLLLGTKNTRLAHSEDVASWSQNKKAEHLSYMRDTIKSSWEFVRYTFEITEVSRSFTHQLVRTRTGVYAQESQRTVDVRNNEVIEPESLEQDEHLMWTGLVERIKDGYVAMIEAGVPVQDAREILPTAMGTSIKAQFSLRALHEMAMVRLCTRTQGMYQEVFRMMRNAVINVHPWVEEHGFIEVKCVSEGVCAFPRFGRSSCQHWAPWMDREPEKAALRQTFWLAPVQVAVPVARDGKTM